MAPVVSMFVVMTAYGQTPHAMFDQQGKLVSWLRSLQEIPYLTIFKVGVNTPFMIKTVTLQELMPDYVPPGEEPQE